MKNSKALKVYLFLSGLLLTFIGGATLFLPVEMKSGSGIDIAGNINVINDVRAASALFLVIGLLIMSGAFLRRLTYTAGLISFLAYLFLGIGRLVSIILDGMPVESIVKATIVEFVIGAVGALLFALSSKHLTH